MGRFSKFTLQQKITAVILATSCIVLVLSSSIRAYPVVTHTHYM